MDNSRHLDASKLKVLLPAHTLPRSPAPSAPPVFFDNDSVFIPNNDCLYPNNTQSLDLNQFRSQNNPQSQNQHSSASNTNGGNNAQICSGLQEYRTTPPRDVLDDEPEPSAPSLELLEKVTGYENTSFDILDVPPPTADNLPNIDEEQERKPMPSGPIITEAEARQALLKYVSQFCCYGKSAARDMAVTSIDHSCAFHYTLETFSEKRQTTWAFEPYTGGVIDGPSAGQAPGPWEVSASPNAGFQNATTTIEIPHTASVKICHTCGGVGRKRCFTCSGNGWEYCNSCHGDGQKGALQGQTDRCFQCNGNGRKKCWKCGGDGLAVCRACGGTGQIKCFIQLTVIWTNHVDDHIVERSTLPEDKIKSVTGQVVFQEERPWVYPINHFHDNTVNIASTQLVQKHASSFPMEKIFMQRHRIRIIPVATAHFHWRGENGHFIVFGFERKIFAPDYPQKYCCCSLF